MPAEFKRFDAHSSWELSVEDCAGRRYTGANYHVHVSCSSSVIIQSYIRWTHSLLPLVTCVAQERGKGRQQQGAGQRKRGAAAPKNKSLMRRCQQPPVQSSPVHHHFALQTISLLPRSSLSPVPQKDPHHQPAASSDSDLFPPFPVTVPTSRKRHGSSAYTDASPPPPLTLSQ